ncbi:MAG: histidine phosphatase family protein [Chromatiales bacterium]|nr:MAG: histidine phosphatase family protein [Chromatiales bacterium]
MFIATEGHRTTLDGASRRRIYLFRHGSVDYFDSDGNVVADTDAVALNDTGRSQAVAMRELFADVPVDKALCSGLLRTRQTGETVLAPREIALEVHTGFVEIQQLKGEATGAYDVVADVAFTHFRATDQEARFLGGERYSDFYSRIQTALLDVLADDSWHSLAVFAHGATNAAVLGWVTGLGCSAFGILDQATCCLNVIDIDIDDNGRVLRKTVRAMNVTADDPAKSKRHFGDMETLAHRMLNQNDAAKPV